MIPLSQRLQQSQQMTPPPSPGKRRHLLRQSEETEGEMTLETFLYNSDAWRCSSFKTPWPLLLTLEAPDPRFHINGEVIGPLASNVRWILAEHSMTSSVVCVMTSLVSKRGYPGGDSKALTLVIYMDQPLPRTSLWASARDELKMMFRQNGLPYMQIEIFDRKRAFMPWLVPLSPADQEVQYYEQKREELLNLVKTTFGTSWKAMSLFGLGTRASTFIKAALVIMIQPNTFQDWSDIRSRLRAILYDLDLPIEFLAGGVVDSRGTDLRDQLTTHPQMRSSIGELGEIGAGTLGGHVILRRNGRDHFGILTTHCVVTPFSALPETVASFGRYGYGFTHPNFTTLI